MTYAVPESTEQVSGSFTAVLKPLIGEHLDVRFAKFSPEEDLHSAALVAQRDSTTIELEQKDGEAFPVARTSNSINFASFVDKLDGTSEPPLREKAIWRMCSLLFDPIEVAAPAFLEGIPDELIETYSERMRMDALQSFWAKEIAAVDVQRGLKHARSPEEKAIVLLTGHDIAGACEVLIHANDFKLAALLARLPGNEQSRALMSKQIQSWIDRNDWSEMSEPVRALYSVLAGQVCKVQGKSGAVENRARAFNFSEKFELTWQQNFGLRLFYGGFENLADVIVTFSQDIESGAEPRRPVKRFGDGKETTDTLMDLLSWYAGKKDAAALFDPMAVSGNPLNSRLAWQLASIFSSSAPADVSIELFDKMTYDLSTELEGAGELIPAAWTLLHLTHYLAREVAITKLLERNADQISEPGEHTSRGTFEFLAENTQIPAPLIWRAKALHASAISQDPALQASWLLRAGDVDEAHAILSSTVGPKAVVEQDYESLTILLEQFAQLRGAAEEWSKGGQVYIDFLHLLHLQSTDGSSDRDLVVCARKVKKDLAHMNVDGGRKKSLEERVAEMEMARVVEEVQRDLGEPGRAKDAMMSGVDDASGSAEEMLRSYRNAMGALG